MGNNIFKYLLNDENEILNVIKSSLNNNSQLLLTYLNQHCFNIYYSNQKYRNLLDDEFEVYVDGIGIWLTLNKLFNIKYKKFNATDLNEKIISYLISEKINFYFIGGKFSNMVIENKLKDVENFCGYQKGYFNKKDYGNIIRKIKESNVKIIFVGMGVPKQEYFAKELSNELGDLIIICVGNFFEFYFGTIKRISERFRNSGIEWIFRLFQEPKRLWKRYFIGIPLFIFRVIKLKFSVKTD